MMIDLDISNYSDILSDVLNDCPTGIIITDNSGIIKIVNKKVCEISGYNLEEIVDSDIDILTHHRHTENSLRYLISNSFTYIKWQGCISIRQKCGKLTLQKVRMLADLNASDIEGYIVFYFDSDLTVNEENRNSEALISLGKMSAYLSHEIKTPLTAIKMNVDMISRDPNLPLSRVRSMQIIKNEISRLERLSKDVLYFSRSTRNTDFSFKLSDSIDEINSLLFPQLEERSISLKNNLKPDTLIYGDQHSIKTLFMHLIQNSIESIKQYGTIDLWNDPADDNFSIPIFIQDTGEGIKEPENIFKFFFTSKPTGTGLGLSIAKKIVEDHSGSIELISFEKGNTIFKIMLPQGSC